ncbi:MAG: VanW family protein [Bacillota bacterium]|jgi:hypothetical protein
MVLLQGLKKAGFLLIILLAVCLWGASSSTAYANDDVAETENMIVADEEQGGLIPDEEQDEVIPEENQDTLATDQQNGKTINSQVSSAEIVNRTAFNESFDKKKAYVKFTCNNRIIERTMNYHSSMSTWIPVAEFVSLLGGNAKWMSDPGVIFFSVGNRTFAYCAKVNYLYIVQRDAKGYFWQKVYYTQPIKKINDVNYLNSKILKHLGMSYSWRDSQHKLDITLDPAMHGTGYFAPTQTKAWELVGSDLKKNIPKAPTTALLGSYTTYFDAGLINRTTNIRLAAQAINNKVVKPGATFSFNSTVGPRTPAKGYKKAIIFQNGKQVQGYGGGVCQVSTTLFNAARSAKLTIVERHSHSLPVSYATPGNDASVYYGVTDFRFRNNTKNDILIKTIVGKNYITIQIYRRIV